MFVGGLCKGLWLVLACVGGLLGWLLWCRIQVEDKTCCVMVGGDSSCCGVCACVGLEEKLVCYIKD